MEGAGEPSLSKVEALLARVSQSIFGRPLVTNVFRALLVEAMIADALEPDWRWCSADYASWDFEHADRTRLEVKQSAARQSWADDGAPPTRCSFDIAERTGRYEGATWIEERGRPAQIFVLAHHPLAGSEADHRDPDQWLFYVVPTASLPSSATIGLTRVASLASPVRIERLAETVNSIRSTLIDEDPLKTIREEMFSRGHIRLVQTGSTYAGVVVVDGKAQPTVHGAEPEVWAKLQEGAGRSSAAYFGYEGAVARFNSIFPQGFSEPLYVSMERDYKIAAAERLAQELPLDSEAAGLEACTAAARAFGKTNLLSQFEQARIRDVLKSVQGPDFLKGARTFTRGNVTDGLTTMLVAIRPHGQPSWPMMTYLPFFWRPDEHMFLKPTVTLDFAERVGDRFARAYGSGYEAPVYEALRAMVAETRKELRRLEPRDGIDVQSFIWVIGGYSDKDVAYVRGQQGRS